MDARERHHVAAIPPGQMTAVGCLGLSRSVEQGDGDIIFAANVGRVAVLPQPFVGRECVQPLLDAPRQAADVLHHRFRRLEDGRVDFRLVLAEIACDVLLVFGERVLRMGKMSVVRNAQHLLLQSEVARKQQFSYL